jgi:hypothetical protein
MNLSVDESGLKRWSVKSDLRRLLNSVVKRLLLLHKGLLLIVRLLIRHTLSVISWARIAAFIVSLLRKHHVLLVVVLWTWVELCLAKVIGWLLRHVLLCLGCSSERCRCLFESTFNRLLWVFRRPSCKLQPLGLLLPLQHWIQDVVCSFLLVVSFSTKKVVHLRLYRLSWV